MGLFQEAGLSSDEILVSQLGSDLSDVDFFTVQLTEAEAGMIANSAEVSSKAFGIQNEDFVIDFQKHPGVIQQEESPAGIYYGGGQTSDDATEFDSLRKRLNPLVTNYNQRPEMVFASQPRNAAGGWPLGQLGDQYRYEQSAGGEA